MRGLAVSGELCLEGLELGTHGEGAGMRDAADDLEQLVEQLGVGLVEPGDRDTERLLRCRCHLRGHPRLDGGCAVALGQHGAQGAAATVVEPVDRGLGLARAGRRSRLGSGRRRVAGRSPRAGPRAASRAPRGAPATSRPRCSRACGSSSRTSSQGTARRARMWSTATLRATRRIHAANGTSRCSYLGRVVISFVKTCWVTSSASKLVADDAPHVSVDVVHVAEVEEAQGLLVAGLGAGDGLGDDPVQFRAFVELGAALKAPRRASGVRARRRARGMHWSLRDWPSMEVGVRSSGHAAKADGRVRRPGP